MGFVIALSTLIMLASAILIVGFVTYNRKKGLRVRLKVPGETLPTVTPEKNVTPQKPQPPAAVEAELRVAVKTPPTSISEPQPQETFQVHSFAIADKTEPPAVDEAQPSRAQEGRPVAKEASQATAQETVPNETQSTVIVKEVQTSQIGELQAIAVGEAPAITAEETELTVTRSSQQQETEKVPPQGVAEAGVEVTRGRREPIKRGGKPRGATQHSEKEPMQRIQPRRSNPEIVCWKRERQWVVAVELPEELLGKPDLTVVQNGTALPPDESEEACWRLEAIIGKVIVRWNEAEAVHEAKVDLGQDNYLLFKLIGQNLDRGCHVKFPSSGWFLVIAPNDWKRDELSSGPPRVAPEPVCLAEYQAHFFEVEREGNQKIAFCLPNGRSEVIDLKTSQFELIGSQIRDASEHMGPLFGVRPPQIRALDAKAWLKVPTIVVGEEGSGRRRWRSEFTPDPNRMDQDLPPEIADRKSGWYFLRFYDANDELIESLDFRFISSLRQITVSERVPLPSQVGHEPIHVIFEHEPTCILQPVEHYANVRIVCEGERTVLTIGPDPICDQTCWEVRPQDCSPVEVFILIERIWWAVGGENEPPSDWQDRPVLLTREDFRATSSKTLWLRLPKHRWADKILVGFEQSRARYYDVKVTETMVGVPLRDFGDYDEVGDHVQEHSLRVWIKRDHQNMEGILAVIPASKDVVAPTPIQGVASDTRSWVGVGRKKTAIAKAVMQNGVGEIEINGKRMNDYFRQTPSRAKQFLERLLALKEVCEVLSQKQVSITVEGSSPTTLRQPEAVAHALARALMDYDARLSPLLRRAGFGGVKVKAFKAHRRGKR